MQTMKFVLTIEGGSADELNEVLSKLSGASVPEKVAETILVAANGNEESIADKAAKAARKKAPAKQEDPEPAPPANSEDADDINLDDDAPTPSKITYKTFRALVADVMEDESNGPKVKALYKEAGVKKTPELFVDGVDENRAPKDAALVEGMFKKLKALNNG